MKIFKLSCVFIISFVVVAFVPDLFGSADTLVHVSNGAEKTLVPDGPTDEIGEYVLAAVVAVVNLIVAIFWGKKKDK